MVFGFATNAQADDDRPIQFDQLPKRAQQFLTESFPGDRVSYAKMESDLFDVSYEVILVSCTKIEFFGRTILFELGMVQDNSTILANYKDNCAILNRIKSKKIKTNPQKIFFIIKSSNICLKFYAYRISYFGKYA